LSHTEDKLQRQARLSFERKALLEKLKHGGQADEMHVPQIARRQEQGAVPLSFVQQRLWFLDQLEPGNPFYNIYVAFHLAGSLHVQALQQSLQALIQRHESLRTTFSTEDEQPVQIIHSAISCDLMVVDISSLPASERQEAMQQLARDEAQRAFDLIRGPLVRTRLVRMEHKEHVLLVTMHHIISDGWSMGVFMRELAVCYNAFVAGQPFSLSDLPIQYADYVLWQRQQLRDEVLDRHREYWRERLAQLPAPLEVPADRPRPAVQTYRGGSLEIKLPRALCDALKQFSRRERSTLFITLLAAFQALLARYTGQEDIVIGTDATDRANRETEELIGFFVNTMVVRTDLSGNPTFRELLERVRTRLIEDLAYRNMPFDMLVADLQPDRHLSRSALVQIMFDLQDTQILEDALVDLRLTRIFIDGGTAKFDLVFDLWETHQGLGGVVEFNTDLFERETIVRLVRHWQTLLEAIMSDPDQRIKDLPLLSAEERQQMLVEWNNSTVDYPTHRNVSALFEEQAMRSPDRVAIVYQDMQLTYEEINVRANRLAHYLQTLGVGPEVLVGIYLDRSVEMLIAILAVFKAGGAYVPLDLSFPKERLEFVLNDTQVSVILTTSARGIAPSVLAPIIVCLDALWSDLADYGDQAPVLSHCPAQLAYVIYTSGSTGRPKGAMLSQEGMINHLYAKIEVLNLTRDDRIAQTASLGFDISLWQFLAVLLRGGRVCILSDEDVYNPARLLWQVIAEGISILELVPSQLRTLLDEVERMESTIPEWMGLRLTISTGEAISPLLCRRWLQRLVHVPLVNTYGATECSDDVTHALVGVAPSEQGVNVPVGRPIANMQAYVLDSSLMPVPVGVTGYIYLGGIGVGRGYLNDTQRTATAFLPDPYGREGGRLYQTGDLGRYLADGQIECLGRVDYQVKVRGHRVELGEIEVILDQHPALRESVVIDREEPSGDKRLVAYMVTSEQRLAPTVKELRAYLQKKLPDYMVPSHFVFLEMLPLTPNGKVDRRALPAPDQARAGLDVAFVAPRSLAEEVIAEIWAELLAIDQVGIYDNFFALGGHSLLATQVISRIQNIFQMDVPLRCLFEAPTVDGLVSVLAQMKGGREVIEEIAVIFKEVERLTEEEITDLEDPGTPTWR
jgi:amino acid adenylation domain-containing protein